MASSLYPSAQMTTKPSVVAYHFPHSNQLKSTFVSLQKQMTKPTKQAVTEMTNAIMRDLQTVKPLINPSTKAEVEAWAGIETFVAIGLRVFAQTNHSKLREVMRLIEIQARMDGREVIES